LTSHLLAFSRRQPLQPREVDINELLVKSARLLRPSLGEQTTSVRRWQTMPQPRSSIRASSRRRFSIWR
jgi:hypothetical protein